MSEAKCLLLDQSFQAIKAISWQRAVTLLTLGKIEVISEHDGFVRSPTVVLKMPAVARLLHVFKRYRKPVKFSRISVFARDKFSCGYCGKKHTINNLTYDHVIPKSRGGITNWQNIITSCFPCNAKKGNRTPEEAEMKLRSVPERPNWVPAIEIQLSNKKYPNQWKDYLHWDKELDKD